MKLRIVSLTILCLALTAPALGDLAPGYDNGPINGTTDAWAINFGYVVSDTFIGTGYVEFFQLGAWEFPGDKLTSLDWSVTDSENAACPGPDCLGHGTASDEYLKDQFISTNQFGYNIDLISVWSINVRVDHGSTYWLNLQNAVVPSGDPVYWDENSGAGCHTNGCPSSASESAVGTIPSEAFTINAVPTTTPEPGSILLFGSGILGLAGVIGRKLL
jgi:hypothetical protein